MERFHFRILLARTVSLVILLELKFDYIWHRLAARVPAHKARRYMVCKNDSNAYNYEHLELHGNIHGATTNK